MIVYPALNNASSRTRNRFAFLFEQVFPMKICSLLFLAVDRCIDGIERILYLFNTSIRIFGIHVYEHNHHNSYK
jgi:hypothetical protein